MMRRNGALLAPVILLAAAGCDGPSMRLPGDGQASTQDALMPQGIQASALPDPDSRGARLVARYCSQCHGIPSPARHAAADWVPTLRRMFLRMGHMRGMGGMMMGRRGMMGRMATPTAAEERTILDYMQGHAMHEADASALPAGEGADVFQTMCSRCHALPDPMQHTPAEWPGVVARMRQNMETMNVEPITDAEAQAIIRYLEGAAGGSGAPPGA